MMRFLARLMPTVVAPARRGQGPAADPPHAAPARLAPPAFAPPDAPCRPHGVECRAPRLALGVLLAALLALPGRHLAAGPPNFALPTFPGALMWATPEPVGTEGWKVQRHTMTGHWRLLDGANIRRAWGSRAQCLAAYQRLVVDVPPAERRIGRDPEPNVPFPTLGGKQVWMDRRVRHGWRVQVNVLTGHARLLDPRDTRLAWGTFEAMLGEWERVVVPAIAAREAREGRPERIVICINGIVRSKDTWLLNLPDISREARRRGRVVEAWGLNYPSTRVSIEEAAAWLDEAVAALPPDIPLVIVCHSMGGLVANAWLGRRGWPASEGPHRVEAILYFGSPFAGSPLADAWRTSPLYEAAYGPAGQQLVTSPAFLRPYPWPDCRTICFAGSRPPHGYHRDMEGDDDGTVPLASALHPAATEHRTVAATHSFLMFTRLGRRAVIDAVFGEGVGEGRPSGAARD